LTRQLVATPLDCDGADRHRTEIRDSLDPAPAPPARSGAGHFIESGTQQTAPTDGSSLRGVTSSTWTLGRRAPATTSAHRRFSARSSKRRQSLSARPWCSRTERPGRWKMSGLTNCTVCESRSGATKESGRSRPSNSRSADAFSRANERNHPKARWLFVELPSTASFRNERRAAGLDPMTRIGSRKWTPAQTARRLALNDDRFEVRQCKSTFLI
jgi:hypothetical protein